MPRYFFHILQPGESVIPDEEGAEFEDLENARKEAAASLRDLMADAIRRREDPAGIVIEIADATGAAIEAIHTAEVFN